MFAAILKTWSYLRTIDFKQRHGLLTAGSPSEGGGGGGRGTGQTSLVVNCYLLLLLFIYLLFIKDVLQG